MPIDHHARELDAPIGYASKFLAGGGFIAQQRNAVLVGGTGTGKTLQAIASQNDAAKYFPHVADILEPRLTCLKME